MAGRIKTVRYDFYSRKEIDAIVAAYLKLDGSNANQTIDIEPFKLNVGGLKVQNPAPFAVWCRSAPASQPQPT